MKKRNCPVEQYAFMNKNLNGPSDKFLKETAPLIGFIVHRFNTIEELLNSSICEWISDRSDMMGLQVIHKMSYRNKVDLFERILNVFQHDLEKQMPIFEHFVKKLKEVGVLRNQVVHSDWESAYENGYTPNKVKINTKGIQYEYIQFSSENLKKILQLIDETCDMFDQYYDKIQELYSTE